VLEPLVYPNELLLKLNGMALSKEKFLLKKKVNITFTILSCTRGGSKCKSLRSYCKPIFLYSLDKSKKFRGFGLSSLMEVGYYFIITLRAKLKQIKRTSLWAIDDIRDDFSRFS